MSDALLEVKGLKVAFASGRKYTEVVSDISFTVHPGEVLALVGESGCGKSSACLALTGLAGKNTRVSGRAYFGSGADRCDLLQISGRKLRRIRGAGIAYIFQEPGSSLNPVMRIDEQLAEVIYLHRPDVRDVKCELISLLAAVGIPDPAKRLTAYPHELSGGMQQRVMIAMALAGNPQLLIADEPTTALDVTIQAQILELLDKLRRERNMALLLISHNLGVVGSLADRIAVMYAGKIVEYGSTAEIFTSPLHPYTQALLKAVPQLGGSRERLQTIAGMVPPPGEYPAGCRFSPRCSRCQNICSGQIPEMRAFSADHYAACTLCEVKK